MKKTTFLTIFPFLIMAVACSPEGEKAAESKELTIETQLAENYPEGYPSELKLHDIILIEQFRFGKGKINEGESGEKNYKSFIVDQLNPKYRDNIIKHYKHILKENNWQGNWDITEDGKSGKGNFTKNNAELTIKINDAMFCLKVKVFQIE